MPDLASLTDYDPVVDQPIVADPARRIPVYKDDDPPVEQPSKTSVAINNVLNKLFRDDNQRYQLWPEKVVREAITGAHDVGTGESPRWAIDPNTGDVHTSPQMVEKAQAISALAGTGGLGGVTDATLGATPFLRPALKYKDKLYKGKEGQQHMDVIPEHLYPEFQDMAMKGEDISHYNFGFHNDKGQFLSREKALEYGINTGLIDPQAGKFGALTSTLMADSTKPGMAIEAMGKANPFFSAVEHNVNAIPQTKMNGEAWLGTLSNKPGVKPEELDWTGLKSFLEDNKGKLVTKEQIQSHLEQNKVELKEVVKGGEVLQHKAKYNAEFDDWNIVDNNGRVIDTGYHNQRAADREILRLAGYEQNVSAGAELNRDTKYHSYQLPGGENYREMLLTLPEKINIEKNITEVKTRFNLTDNDWNKLGASAKDFYLNKIKNNISNEGAYKSSHWDEPNILAHVRMNDRDVGGKKSLHLEEIQSDWHQQGRDKGYKLNNIEERKKELNEKLFDAINKAPADLSHIKKLDWAEKNIPEFKAWYKEKTELSDTSRAGGVPDAPFKKSWHELALKRMIREAAEKGYDRLSWTPGEAQAARYDLSKQVSTLHYDPKDKVLTAVGKDGKNVLREPNVAPDKIADFVGKEAAKKLLETTPKPDLFVTPTHNLHGEDLKIGGEGMKGFYDQIIPRSLEKIGKEHGVKVKQDRINKPEFVVNPEKLPDGREIYDVKIDGKLYSSFHTKAEAEAVAAKAEKEQKGTPIHYIDIPTSLRDAAMHKGFPLFSSTHMFVPVDHDPFEKKK